jgi:hypothetical protein
MKPARGNLFTTDRTCRVASRLQFVGSGESKHSSGRCQDSTFPVMTPDKREMANVFDPPEPRVRLGWRPFLPCLTKHRVQSYSFSTPRRPACAILAFSPDERDSKDIRFTRDITIIIGGHQSIERNTPRQLPSSWGAQAREATRAPRVTRRRIQHGPSLLRTRRVAR